MLRIGALFVGAFGALGLLAGCVGAPADAPRVSATQAGPGPSNPPLPIEPTPADFASPRPTVSAPRVALGVRAPQRDRKSGGCGKTTPTGVRAGTTSVRTLDSGGQRRSYRLYLPRGYTIVKALPVVLSFHGRHSSAAEFETYSGMVPLAEREGFALVTPDGTGTPRGWSAGATPPGGVDDVAFVHDLLATLSRELCVDSARVFATGFSNGAFFASRLACQLGGEIAAVVAVSGVDRPSASCPNAVPILAIHGTDDAVVPFDGGKIREWVYPGAPAALAAWASGNGCVSDDYVVSAVPGGVRQDWTGCLGSVSLLMVTGGGHTWPGAVDTPTMGVTSHAFNAGDVIWAFFAAQSPAS